MPIPPRKGVIDAKVVIVGAGVSGLMAALECWRRGFTVEVVERSDGTILTGDTVSLGPSSIRVFRHWPQITREHNLHGYNALISYVKVSGEPVLGPIAAELGLHESTRSEIEDAHEPRFSFMHARPQLYQTLLQQCHRCGIKINFNNFVVRYTEREDRMGAEVETLEGEVYTGDVIIAADGVSSKSWEAILPEKPKARSSGFAMFRAAFPVERAFANPCVRQKFALHQDGRPRWDFWVGKDTHFTAFTSKDLATFSFTHLDNGEAAESWRGTMSPKDVLRVMKETAEWDDAVYAFIESAPEQSIIDWKLLWRDPQPKWTSPGGRIVQIGDAAHSFLPTSGGGATQALEDAACIAACLEMGGKQNISMSTRVHQKLRFERVSCHQLKGFMNRQMIHQTNWEAVAKNPSLIEQKHGQWINSHDPEEYVEQMYWPAYYHLTSGTSFSNTNIPPGYLYRPWTIEEILQEESNMTALEGDWS